MHITGQFYFHDEYCQFYCILSQFIKEKTSRIHLMTHETAIFLLGLHKYF